jgi:hypothetical protein
MQPFLTDCFVIENVPAGPHTLDIEWRKETIEGRIVLREYEVILVAYESKLGKKYKKK